jgi:hypothetical protein
MAGEDIVNGCGGCRVDGKNLLVNREQTSFSTVRRSAWVADADALPTPKPVPPN